MSDKDLAQAIVDWFMENDCTREKAMKAIFRILKGAAQEPPKRDGGVQK